MSLNDYHPKPCHQETLQALITTFGPKQVKTLFNWFWHMMNPQEFLGIQMLQGQTPFSSIFLALKKTIYRRRLIDNSLKL